MQRGIYVPSINQWVSVRAYVRAVKTAKANPDITFQERLTTWWPTTGAEVVQQFREGMHERISVAIPYSKRGSEEA